MSGENQKDGGGLKRVAILVFGVLATVTFLDWWSNRPGKLLKRFLETDWSDRIERVESVFIGGLDYTAHLYLEGDPEFLREIARANQFEEIPIEGYDRCKKHLDFSDAPAPPQEPSAVFEKTGNSPLEYLVLSKDGGALWYVALDF
jgi:hypothetical protein